MREQGQGEGDRVPRIGERSESFNERLVAQLGSGSGGQIAEVSSFFFFCIYLLFLGEIKSLGFFILTLFCGILEFGGF